MKPVALVVPEDTSAGRRFYPANEHATRFAAIAGTACLSETHLQHIRLLGFEVAETNGQPIPIPHPWNGYRRQVQPEPKHIWDEV